MNKELSTPVLRVKNLSIGFGQKPVVKDLSFEIYQAKTLALVGESGSGKTLTALSIANILPKGARVLETTALEGILYTYSFA